ncbi:MAG: hypothetical protein IJC71_06115 [Clostridia bacterium]|nr:hypothetical protein [Clostridia bacterium]
MKKKKIIVSALLFILALLLPILLLAAMDTVVPAQYGESFLAGLGLKYDLLKSETEPKIVIIGGSSTAFGIDSALMEEHLPYKVVNFGLYATLGTKLMLDLSEDCIREGDIVVIAPELDKQTLSLYFNAQSTWQAAESDRTILTGIDFDNAGDMLGGYWDYIAQKIGHHRQGIAAAQGVYSLSALDEHGDIDYPKESNTMLLGYDPNMIVDLTPELIDEAFIDYLNKYAENVQKKGAVCCFSFPPTNASALAEGTDSEKILDFFMYTAEKLHFEVISDINHCIMDEGYFYDTNFHLNNTGTTAHTILLIEDLRRLIGDTTPLTLEIPAPPEKEIVSAESPADQTDETDWTAFYTYEELAAGYMITGVTDEGKTADVLKTPASYDGKAVIAVGEGAFAGCKAKEIHIGQSVVQLYNRLFDGCANLERIYLYAEKAGNIAAGDGLFDGAPEEAGLYMPLEAYSSFVSDYFWTKFAARMNLTEEADA